MLPNTDEERAWADDLRDKYGIPYAIDHVTSKEEIEADDLTD